MLTPAPRISLADLSAAGIRLRPIEAVTIARELMLRASRGLLPGIPSPHVVRFTMDGEILIEGPVAAGRSVERAARLLETMLPGFDAPPEQRASGALRLVMARAAGTLDLPAYETLDAFAEALQRFASPDRARVVRGLCASWNAAVNQEAGSATGAAEDAEEAETITVSDVRRARRATGLSLSEIAERSRIPVSLLRELEWGYFVNWPAGHYGRTQLVRYARAAGLDDHIVIRAVAAEYSAAGRTLDAATVHDDREEPVVTSLVPVPAPGPLEPVTAPRRGRRSTWLAALAIPALVAIGFVPALWNGSQDDATVAVGETARQDATREAASDAVPARNAAAAPPVTDVAERDTQVPPPAARADSPAPPPVRSAPQSARRVDTGFSPTFASIGSAMFYHANGDSGSALMRADTNGDGAVLRITRIVDDNAQNFHVRPSPDGSQIAFDSDRDAAREGERAVYVADANGRNVRRITGPGYAAVPSWSPDGRHIAYVQAEEDRPRVWNLWTVDLESGETERVTSHKVGQPWGAAWFPDGERIAYSHETRLIVRSLDGGSQRIYPSPVKGRQLRTPAVSPDGRKIIFQVRGEGAWLLDLTDGSTRRILSDRTAEEFTWSPDGRQVAYHSRQTGKWGVWIMAPR
jgi:cytoskeletal protein RodZ